VSSEPQWNGIDIPHTRLEYNCLSVMERVLTEGCDLTHARVGWGIGTGSGCLSEDVFRWGKIGYCLCSGRRSCVSCLHRLALSTVV